MTQSGGRINDNFMAMVTAKADVTLPLSEFQPQSTLVTEEHPVERARFAAIDYHRLTRLPGARYIRSPGLISKAS